MPTLPATSCWTDGKQDWPSIFGPNALEVTTIRKLWNTFWHQMIRETYTKWSHGIMGILGIQRGTWLSTYFQLYFTFLFSGVGHGIV